MSTRALRTAGILQSAPAQAKPDARMAVHRAWQPGDLQCPDCGGPMRLVKGKHGVHYGCIEWPECKGNVGAHADGTPLGTPANAATRKVRAEAHDVFDALWKGEGKMPRSEAYSWLAATLNLSREETHIGQMGIAQCRTVIAVVQAREEFLALNASVHKDRRRYKPKRRTQVRRQPWEN